MYHFAPCTVDYIILPRAWGKMIQLTTNFEWFVSSTNAALCLYFFLSSCSQYLTVYYTSKSNNIYPVIKAGKKYFKKVDYLAPVSSMNIKLSLPGFRTGYKYTAINISIDCISVRFLFFLLMCLYYYYFVLLFEAARILALKTCKFDQFRNVRTFFLLKRKQLHFKYHTYCTSKSFRKNKVNVYFRILQCISAAMASPD